MAIETPVRSSISESIFSPGVFQSHPAGSRGKLMNPDWSGGVFFFP